MARKKAHEEHEEHVDESWLVPYADILTLLLALFIVLFASSQTDEKKMLAMESAFYNAFGFGSGPGMLNGAGVFMFQPSGDGPDHGSVTVSINDPNFQYVQENQQLTEVKDGLDSYIKQNDMVEDLNTVMVPEGLLIRIKEKALFESGSAILQERSQKMALPVAAILNSVNQKVVISGHTDNVPIDNFEYQSNWDLSTRRALNFMKYLLATSPDLDPSRFSVVGCGEYSPAASNDTEEGKAQNRRVEVLISRTYHDNEMQKLK